MSINSAVLKEWLETEACALAGRVETAMFALSDIAVQLRPLKDERDFLVRIGQADTDHGVQLRRQLNALQTRWAEAYRVKEVAERDLAALRDLAAQEGWTIDAGPSPASIAAYLRTVGPLK